MKVGLLGHGVVGSGVCRIIDQGNIENISVKKILVKTEAEISDERMTTSAEEVLNDPDIDVICECMGGIEPAASYVRQALENGKSAVTSNKKMLAEKAEELCDCAVINHVHLRYEASCGGGIPWIVNLERIRRIDEIQSFRGIFNGTTNYILSSMEENGSDFDTALKKAQDLGYAERNPSDDIDGMDVRYKTALTALTAFDALVDPDEIETWGIRHINREDIENAKKMNRSIKLIGQGEKGDIFVSLRVLPVFVKKDSLFASVGSNFNILECSSSTLGQASFIGQGAGSLPTAHAVVQDLIDLSKNNVPEAKQYHKQPVSEMNQTGVFYVRTSMKQVFNAYIDHNISDNAFVTKNVSLMDLLIAAKSAADENLFLAEVE